MSDTTQAAVDRLREQATEFPLVVHELQRALVGEEAERVLRFAEVFFTKAPPGFLGERSPAVLARMVLGTYRFLERSLPGKVNVELSNPEMDSEGWFAPVTILRTNVSERPFIVDTIREFLRASDLAIEVNIYPVLRVQRDEDGRVESVAPSQDGGPRESVVHCEITRVSRPDRLKALQEELTRRLEDVVRVTDDFQPMVRRVEDTVVELEETARSLPERTAEVREIQEFLQWLQEGGFVFLGARDYDLTEGPEGDSVLVKRGSGLGILRREELSTYRQPVSLASRSPRIQQVWREGPVLLLSKTRALSTVHRRARMDHIGVKRLDSDGRVIGERRFLGLFTSTAFSERAERIPILRKKLEWILQDFGVREGTHDYKEIHTIFNSLPKEDLFLTSAEVIARDVRTILTTYPSDEVRVSFRMDALQRGVTLMVILPKEKFSGAVRQRIEAALVRILRAEVLHYHLALGEGDQARLHFYLTADADRLKEVSPRFLEEEIRLITRDWRDRVREELERIRPAEGARRLARFYAEALPPEYQTLTDPETAVRDILELEAMRADGREVAIHFARSAEEIVEPSTELKLYLRGPRLVLSDFMPILENCGLRVISVTPFDLLEETTQRASIYAFAVLDPAGAPLQIDEVGTRLAETILAIRAGEVSNGTLNSLVLSAGLTWREVDVLRSYASYAFQAGLVPSRLNLPSALNRYPDIARQLFQLFEIRFDPEGPRGTERGREADRVRLDIQEALGGVASLSDDRALRRLRDLIDATLRTNYYRWGGRVPTRRSGGVPYLSFKFDSAKVEGGRSRLRAEIWVRSSRMEGVHLRGARVARGGIRHSDRLDDFRTEVLGLVRTQMVKNAVIVPGGSKGGFVLLQSFSGDAAPHDAQEQYRTLVRGLLDLTDNLQGGEPIPPDRVLCYDEPDPYLVVAADKGTAKFSDIANGVAAEYNFWLGDAFASGGSNGYDHKEVGITAGGAWICVRRHFLELGKDIQAEPFTVIGVGDMSGDVFGNGMLLSRQIRLLGAFDHRHIFIDPDPDPETSYQERERLFQLGRSSWADYDSALLSPGGGVVPRGSKEIRLSPEARRVLGIEGDEVLDGETLIRHLLRAPVDLLWNGGIGTYVKASSENHGEVGDGSNDAVRVDAEDLRCRVIGEGGNLGLTQRARIEFALAGGRLNTDAIDNSGGVDLSDREVNLKILLAPGVEDGDFTSDQRNVLLRQLQPSVAELVLRDNESQSLAISLEELRAEDGVEDLRELISALEKLGILDRLSEGLPSWETVQERLVEGKSFTRPELSVLLAYAKRYLASELLRSDIPEDPSVAHYLRAYFPPEALEVAGVRRLEQHRLRREIVASQLTNEIVPVMGVGFVQRLSQGTGQPPADVVRAWLLAVRLTDYAELTQWFRLGGDRPLPVVYRWLLGLSRVLERTTRWILSHQAADAALPAQLEDGLRDLDRLRTAFSDLVRGRDREIFLGLVEELQRDGASETLARRLITLRFLDQLLEILRVQRSTGTDALGVAQAYFQIAERLGLTGLRDQLFRSREDRWEKRAAQTLADDVSLAHQRWTEWGVQNLAAEEESDNADFRRVEPGLREAFERYEGLRKEVEEGGDPSLPALTVWVRALNVLTSRLPATAL